MNLLIGERTVKSSVEMERAAIACQSSGRTSGELEALLRTTSVLGSVTRLEQLERKLLETISEVIPAERGVIILVGDSKEHFTSIFGWDRTPERHHPVAVSRGAIERVLRKRVVRWSYGLREWAGRELRRCESIGLGGPPVATAGCRSRKSLLQAVNGFCNGYRPADDLTLLVIRFLGDNHKVPT